MALKTPIDRHTRLRVGEILSAVDDLDITIKKINYASNKLCRISKQIWRGKSGLREAFYVPEASHRQANTLPFVPTAQIKRLSRQIQS